MRVLGIDPGSAVTGYGIVDTDGQAIRHVDNGAIRPDSNFALPKKLEHIYKELRALIEKYAPDVTAIENVFVAKNVRTSLMLGHARGAAMLAASQSGIEIAEYNPTAVKLAVVGQGRADKNQIQQMVRVILRLPEIAIEDASDALAAAICHCNTAKFKLAVERSVEKTDDRGQRTDDG